MNAGYFLARAGSFAFFIAFAVLLGGCGEDTTNVTTNSPGTGGIEVSLTLSGYDLDPNGTTVMLDGREERVLLPDVPLTFFGLEPGNHTVWVRDLSANCLAPNNPRPLDVQVGQTAQAEFVAVCEGPAPHLEVSKLGLGMPPGYAETMTVRATDQTGAEEGWTVATSNGNVASLVAAGDSITVTAGTLGTATITVTSASGVARQIPVRVYDPLVLDVGPLLIKVVDQFAFRAWMDNWGGDGGNDTWYDPVISEEDRAAGWRALGSVWTPNRESGVNGTTWMLIVKDNEPPGNPPALADPDSYAVEHQGWVTAGGDFVVTFYTPICPAGYVAMGAVVGAKRTMYSPPQENFFTCVRQDLTADASVDLTSGVSYNHHGMWILTAPNLVSPTAWLEAGTFVYQGYQRSCPSDHSADYLCTDPQYDHPARHVLAVDLPVIIDTPFESRVPPLTGYDQPPLQTLPIGTITMLTPFTTLLGGTAFGGADMHWMVENSPIVQVERVVYNRLMFHTINNTSVVQENALTFTSGTSETNQESFSHTAGVSISVQSGVSFLGSGGGVTITASYQFGYETLNSVTALEEKSTTVTVFTVPGKAAAAWQQRNAFRVKRHRLTAPGLYQIDNVGEMEFGIDTWVVSEYPQDQ